MASRPQHFVAVLAAHRTDSSSSRVVVPTGPRRPVADNSVTSGLVTPGLARASPTSVAALVLAAASVLVGRAVLLRRHPGQRASRVVNALSIRRLACDEGIFFNNSEPRSHRTARSSATAKSAASSPRSAMSAMTNEEGEKLEGPPSPTSLAFSFNTAPRMCLSPPTYLSVSASTSSVADKTGGNPAQLNYTCFLYMSFAAALDVEHATTEDFKRQLHYFYDIVEDTYGTPFTGGGCCVEIKLPRLKTGACQRMPWDGGQEDAVDLITFESWENRVLKGWFRDPAEGRDIEITGEFEIHFPRDDSGRWMDDVPNDTDWTPDLTLQ
mmetsp:Transcript_99293/g.320137  ORF Transcript_99293/g.320137 Transcript_99293/m.320137 type:complete len:325 (+) Transcript_99293:158-1132(+)